METLWEQEAGMKTADVCRKHGFTETTFYTYEGKYGGMNSQTLAD